VVLLAVLVVIVMLTLAAYQYSAWMTAEYRAANAQVHSAQARALADSGVHYAAALLANRDASSQMLGGNPFDNPSVFKDVPTTAAGPGSRPGTFSVLALRPPEDQAVPAYRFGVVDEAGKINLNALLALDNGKGDVGKQLLLGLPNMTDDIASAILDWLDPDQTPRSGGAEDEYYSTLSPSYRCKNGPLDSLEELLLVRGVIPQLLFGNDLNYNGTLDLDEGAGGGPADQGRSAYLTV